MKLRLHLAVIMLAGATTPVATGCKRERREYQLPESMGLAPSTPNGPSPFEGNAWATGEGKRLFVWMNCSGCHANGGGGMGPALMDREWRYGSSPEDVFLSIAAGRPNGMPSYRDRLSEEQTWKLTEYVRSMSGLTPLLERPGRSDSLYPGPAEVRRTHDPKGEVDR